MKDILRELQSLSLKLQRREMTLVDSSVHIKQTINVLTAMKTTGGRSTKKAEQGVSSGFFKDVELTEGRGKINKPRFYESVVATLTKRLPESSLVQMLKALDKRFWPGEQEDLTLFGEQEALLEEWAANRQLPTSTGMHLVLYLFLRQHSTSFWFTLFLSCASSILSSQGTVSSSKMSCLVASEPKMMSGLIEDWMM
ncbi:hypothetical protein JOQ06_022114 [Pogonophryne albipinna]|uniref:Uncharacterized protein n=1 Tax=Pogonophryne albipinna TaxID=1090488 RepID=A0AAD6A527_9TELE|nr:hypothetical protein JOQ06_022114 [Pogonophryne albipinna]